MGRRSYYDTDEERLPEGMTRIGYDADTETYTFRDADGSIWESAPGSRYGNLTKISEGSASARRAEPPTTGRGKGGSDGQRAYNDDEDDDDDHGEDDRAPFLAPPAYSASAAAATLSTRGGSDDALPMPSAAEARYRDWRKRSWRADLMPLLQFFLISSLFLVGIFWMVGGFSGGSSSSPPSENPEPQMPPRPSTKPAAPAGCPDGWATSVVYRGQTCYMIAKMHNIDLDELLSVNKGVNCDLLQVGEMICVPKAE
ncbi:hypothetical protein RB597_002224 [Gaeumannomyces tritici]